MTTTPLPEGSQDLVHCQWCGQRHISVLGTPSPPEAQASQAPSQSTPQVMRGEHTPTPWAVQFTPHHPVVGRVYVCSVSGNNHDDPAIFSTVECPPGEKFPFGDKAADAVLIVRAVNSYASSSAKLIETDRELELLRKIEALLKVQETLKEALRRLMPKVRQDVCGGGGLFSDEDEKSGYAALADGGKG